MLFEVGEQALLMNCRAICVDELSRSLSCLVLRGFGYSSLMVFHMVFSGFIKMNSEYKNPGQKKRQRSGKDLSGNLICRVIRFCLVSSIVF